MEITSKFYLSLYKGGSTGQGNSLAQMVSMSKKIVGLTGTLLNGYASSIFYILYRLNPTLMNKKLSFEYGSVKRFVKDFGAFEDTYEAKDVDEKGVVTKKGRKIGTSKEKPKISPMLLSVLLEMTIFLRLDEIKMDEGKGLPDYNEEVVLVDMEEDIKSDYLTYIRKLSNKIKDKNFEYLGNLANDAICVPDMPFNVHSAQNTVFYEPKYKRKDFGLINKEKELIEHIKKELDQNRKCLVYAHFTGKGIGLSLKEILEEQFPNKTIKFLPVTVKAKKRQAWIKGNPCDVLICNPELVKTGLDLLEFPTIIFYETTYNVFTLKQASRRSWRLGQINDVIVKFFAYEDTPQHKALELIGGKVAAANSLEGRLSGDDDLSSMGEEDDNIQLALARSIMNNESSNKNIEMTSIKNFGNDREWDNFELYYKYKVKEESKLKTEELNIGDIVKLRDTYAEVQKQEGLKVIYGEATKYKYEFLENVVHEIVDVEFAEEDFVVNLDKDTPIKTEEVKEIVKPEIKDMYRNLSEKIHRFYRAGIIDQTFIDKIAKLETEDCTIQELPLNEEKTFYRITLCRKTNTLSLLDIDEDTLICVWTLDEVTKICEDARNNFKVLTNTIKKSITDYKKRDKEEIPTFDNLLEYDGEITSTKKFFYKKSKVKGKKVIEKIEITDDNIKKVIPKGESVQLSLF